MHTGASFAMTSAKWLDFLVFSDKDDKAEVPSHNYSQLILLGIIYIAKRLMAYATA